MMAATSGYEDGMGAAAWQLACSRLSERGAHVLQSEQWSDCVLAVGRERREVRAHRLLLAMASPVLAHALYVEFNPERPGPVPVPDVEPDTFHAVLLYIYTDRVELASDSAARELYYAAQRFALPHLVAACSAHLSATLSHANVCAALEVVEVLGDDERLDAPLREQCLQLMRSETAQVLGDSGLLSARPRTVETLFALEPLQIRSEMELFRAAERYVAHHKSTRTNVEAEVEVKETLRGALQKIRFLTLEATEFVEHDVSSLLSAPEQLAILNNIVSANTSLPMPSGFSSSRTLRHKTRQQLEREADERLREEDEERKREAEAEKQRQEERMLGFGALDRLRPAARLSFPVPLSDLSSGVGFLSDDFYVDGLRWWVGCSARGVPGTPTHLHVHLECRGTGEELAADTRWCCVARGRVRVLRGVSAGEGEGEVERATFDRTFSSRDKFISWHEFISWSTLQAFTEDVTDQLILEVELTADPPETY